MNAERRAEKAREMLGYAKAALRVSELACWVYLLEWAMLGGDDQRGD